MSYVCYAVGDVDGGERRATIESPITDAGHAVGDVYGSKAGAISKNIRSNVRHIVRNDNGG